MTRSFLFLLLILAVFKIPAQRSAPSRRITDLLEFSESAFRNQPDVALDSMRLAYKLSFAITDAPLKKKVTHLMGEAFFYMEQFDSAQYFYEKNLKEENIRDDSKLFSETYLGLGAIARNLGNYDLADSLIDVALHVATEVYDTLNMMQAHRLKGIIKKRQYKYVEALEHYLIALRYAEANTDQLMVANAMNGISGIYKAQKNYKKARDFLFRSYQIFTEIEDEVGKTNALNNIGELYLRQHQWDSAIYYLQKALLLIQKRELKKGEGICLYNLGICYRELHRHKDAITALNESASIFFTLGDLRTEIFPVTALIENYKMMGAPERSVDLAKKVMIRAKAQNIHQIVIDLNETLHDIYEANGQFKLANAHLKEHFQYRDSLLNSENSKEMLELQAKYEAEKREQQIANLAQQNQIKDLKLNQQRILLFASVAVFVLVAGIAFFGYRQRQLVVKQRQLTLEQNLLRAQMNPHFIFNALNSIQSFITSNQSQQATLYLAKFGELTRDVLEASSENWIPLEKELKIARNYLDLEQARFQKELHLNLNIQVEAEDYLLVPPMLLQPFLENAIKHGFHGKDGGKIRLSMVEKKGSIYVTIQDDGLGLVEGKSNHQSKAIMITRQRLKNLSRQKSTDITIKNNQANGKGAIVTFDFPVNYAI
ncbi:MAG: tetratricopeptide repeat protein [Bacteroidota bacterium]